MIQKSLFYETSGHTRVVHEEKLFRRLPQSIAHAPYTEGRCSWSRLNDADDNTPAVAILADSNLPTLLITDFKV